MRRNIMVLLSSALFLLGVVGGCGPREYKTYALADFCDAAKAGEYVTVSGIVKIPENILVFDNTNGILLVEDINKAQPFLRIGIPIGRGRNHMERLTDNFTLEDIKIHTNEGQIVTHGETVSISGFYGGSCIAGNSAIKVERIEAK